MIDILKMNLRKSEKKTLGYVYIAFVFLLSSCKGMYTKDDLFFIKPFHYKDTLLFKSIIDGKLDTLCVSKHVEKSAGWNPGFKDDLFYYNSILISIDRQASNNYYGSILIKISKEKSQLTTDLEFGGLGKSIYNNKICCRLDTNFYLNNGQKIKQVYKIKNDISYSDNTNLDLVDTLWWDENYGILMFNRRNGKKWLRVLNQIQ